MKLRALPCLLLCLLLLSGCTAQAEPVEATFFAMDTIMTLRVYGGGQALLDRLAQLARELGHVRVRGLMAIPPVPAHPEDNRPYFLKMQQLFVDIRAKMSDNQSDIDCLSMGMSADFESAILEGATLVRVGTAIFGARSYPA